MDIRGLQKVSLIDYPGGICTTVFVCGCNLRCGYCHNKDLVLSPNTLPKIDEDDIIAFLAAKRGKIDAVCISGGEPTLMPDLKAFLDKIGSMGFRIKLDTNGTMPDVLKELLPILDYVAMDIKAPLNKYKEIVGVDIDTNKILTSVKLLKESHIEHEFRTTLVPLLTIEDIKDIRAMIPGQPYYLQQFRPITTIDPGIGQMRPYRPEVVKRIAKEVGATVRGL